MYKNFTVDERIELQEFIATSAFEKLKALPPYLRSFALEDHLNNTGTALSFSLILGAFWYETDAFVKDPQAMTNLLNETEPETLRATPEARPYLKAILAYALGYTGQSEATKAKLAQLREDPVTPEALNLYLDAVEACLVDFKQEACHPDAPQPR